MSETHSDAAETATAELFDKVELRQFEADDVEAGRAIGKMLSILFIYTVIAMSIVSLWTWVVSK
jgi:hypothetical protein